MEKTRDLFKKIRDSKGTFHAKMSSIKDRNCMKLTETEDIKKRWQEYTFPVYHYLPEFAQTHVHSVGDAIQPSHLLSPPSPFALNLSQHQGLFKSVSYSHQVAKVLELQLPHIFTLNQAGLEKKLI